MRTAVAIVVLITALIISYSAQAVSTTRTLSFQGRLASSTGAIVPDGYYNIQFKIYDGGDGQTAGNPSGSLEWTESHINDGGTSGVHIKNGLFSVQLGALTPFADSVDWDSDQLWLSMNVAGTASDCTTFGSGSCTADGEMLPMKRITATPYSINSGAVGGKSADQLVQLGQGTQTDASDSASIDLNKTGTGDLMRLQSAGSDAFTLKNGGSIELGATTDQSISVAQSAAGAGTSLTLAAGAAATSSNQAGGDLVLQGGAGDGSGDSGSVIVAANGDSAVTFDVQDTANQSVFSVNTIAGSVTASGITLASPDMTTDQISTDNDLAITSAGDMTLSSNTGQLDLQASAIDLDSASVSLGAASSTTTVRGSFQTGTLDTADSSTLAIGSTNAAAVTIGKATTIDASLTVAGAGMFNSSLAVVTDTDTPNAFSVQNASAVNLFTVDTTNNRVTIGANDATGTILVLDAKTTAADPTGTNGAMYYNAAMGVFRCYQAGEWTDCVTPLPVSAVADSDTEATTSTPIDVTDLGFTLAANTKYHYKFVLKHEAAATTTGIGFGVTTPATPVANTWCVSTNAGLTSATDGNWGSYCGVGDATSTTTGSEAAATEYTSTMEGYIETGATGGDLKLRMKSEVDASTTIKSGSFGVLQIVK